MRVVKMQMLDTGIGREAGFKDDADLIHHAKAEREKLDPLTQELLRELDWKIENAFLFGENR